jgi:hypothetical protein
MLFSIFFFWRKSIVDGGIYHISALGEGWQALGFSKNIFTCIRIFALGLSKCIKGCLRGYPKLMEGASLDKVYQDLQEVLVRMATDIMYGLFPRRLSASLLQSIE